MTTNSDDVNLKKVNLYNELFSHMNKLNYAKVEDLLISLQEYGVDIYYKINDPNNKCSPIEYALDLQDNKLIEILLSEYVNDSDIDEIDGDGKTLMHYVCEKDLSVAFNSILQWFSIDALDSKQRTPLHYCAKFGSIKICKLLLKLGAEMNNTDRFGNTPLHIAFNYNHMEIFYEIGSSCQCDLNKPNGKGRSVLLLACIENNVDVVKWLLAKGANVNTFDMEYLTPLIAAYFHNRNLEMYRILCEATNNNILANNIDNCWMKIH